MISITDIHKHFDDQEVLHGISATFEAGKTNLTIGRSGSGKTVLLRCIVGLLTPDQGQVLYDGRDIHRLGKREGALLRQEMGMLFQGAALFDSMDVFHNVLFPLEMFSTKTYREQLQRARFCLDRVGLIEAEGKMPSELSGGMQKRVAIARAIALEPRYLFCDEPNSGLDPISSRLIDRLISDITHEYGITTIVNTHDMGSVRGIGEQVLFIHDGCAEWTGTSHDIDGTDSPHLREFLDHV
ncbi:MAG: ATP-binding cassette domain-containing protein [Bacteroidaceae bacterium]|nr:ATP-binding cassette domain-containing protein [Bacteroidaceae bacterium]